MIRIVCSESDAGMAANVGGPVSTKMRTFDVEIPELEKWLTEQPMSSYVARAFTGIEVLPITATPEPSPSSANRAGGRQG